MQGVKTLEQTLESLIYDWNTAEGKPVFHKEIEFDDETLRDGLQSPSVKNPAIARKLEILHLMVDLGIHAANIGLPGAGAKATEDSLILAKEIAKEKLPIFPNCAARTLKVDIDPIIRISQEAGVPMEASLFIGSSPIRQYVEGWGLDKMLRFTEEAVTYAVKNNLSVMYVTEDTTRARPDTLEKLYRAAIECGADRICFCDTVGYAEPRGVRNLIAFAVKLVKEAGRTVKIDFHGHMDRGLGVLNAIAALEAGADRVHGTALGIGERAGNAPMDLILVNLKLLGAIRNDLTSLSKYCEAVSQACDVPIPHTYPVIGKDAFRTVSGIHAAAIIKAEKKEREAGPPLKQDALRLSDQVYSGIPASWVGRTQEIEVGPMSGESNVVYWLGRRGIPADEALVRKVLARAKESDHTLSESEIKEIVDRAPSPARAVEA
ncbi:MAG: 2-isopropylmalate synthase [Armatimonadetes bacterium]|nr:2-isopropylmalate synthase [Armatimonadota bacterium]